jgi:hypothetical protein
MSESIRLGLNLLILSLVDQGEEMRWKEKSKMEFVTQEVFEYIAFNKNTSFRNSGSFRSQILLASCEKCSLH